MNVTLNQTRIMRCYLILCTILRILHSATPLNCKRFSIKQMWRQPMARHEAIQSDALSVQQFPFYFRNKQTVEKLSINVKWFAKQGKQSVHPTYLSIIPKHNFVLQQLCWSKLNLKSSATIILPKAMRKVSFKINGWSRVVRCCFIQF